MSTAVRAHRILAALANYQKASLMDDCLEKLVDGRLGEAIGRYRNPGPKGEVVGIFADGLAWYEGTFLVELCFTEVSEVMLPNGKEGEELLLKTRDGREHHLPIKGQHGRFFDSVEMLRFLDRVMQDLRGRASTTE